MSDIKWTSLHTWDDVIILQDVEGSADHELFAPIGSILNWSVNWLIQGGQIELRWTTGMGCTLVTFEAGDSGQACSDAIGYLKKALERGRERNPDAASTDT